MMHELETLDDVIDAWARLGAGYLGRMSAVTPDLEHLILRTAVLGVDDPRTFTIAITWLSQYGYLVAEHRLCKLIQDGAIEAEATCGLGLMLDMASSNIRGHMKHQRNLIRPMKLCTPAARPRPYFRMDDANDAMRQRAARRASDVSLRWNLWVEPLELKLDAVRTMDWIPEHNPSLDFRAEHQGDLRTTLLLVLQEDGEAGRSLSELSRRCGVSRTAVVSSVEKLVIARRVKREREGRSCRVRLAA